MTRADWIGLGWAGATGGLVLALGPSALTLGVPAAAAALLVADGVARPASQVLVPTISRGPARAGRRVALTFDDGPDPRWTPAIAERLEAAGVRGTFFCIGEHVLAHPALVRGLAAAGHELGNHSFSHARTLNFRLTAAMEREVRRGETALLSVLGEGPRPLYRPPIGLRNPSLARVARRLDLRVVNWSLHSRDTFARDPAAVADRVLTRCAPGDIVLLHDGSDRPGADRSVTLAALPRILEGLRQRQLEPVTVSELLAS
ncbi:MAG: polysaccharide deacetylase family protein [Deltaproteobacteria bacterium]|nr:polysaccharide deacetylase family protein [Deltaproteobacteria bacterium]MCB9787223.1 polysaccharide deacetylase family protein [Deltaproteobacteria bacterium]